MATVKAIKYGMKGDEVKNLQTTLNNLGYSLDVDGSFGPQTLSAVKDYQKKTGLTVDGMVGPQTQGSLFGGSSGTATNTSAAATSGNATNTQPATTPTTTTSTVNTSESGNKNTGFTYDPYQSSGAVDEAIGDGFSYDDFTYDEYKSSGAVDKAKGDGFSYDNFSYADYAESETVKQANAALQAALAAQPGAYQSKWQDQINGIIDKILNREQFSYDYNEDALYKQYAEQYARGGKLAMQDTMGQAAAMTGGYGSSYASTAGNQAYQEYMSQLNEVIPELYGMALNRYQMEGQEMYNQYGLLSDQEQQDYGRYQDSYNQWLAERDYAAGRYDSERNFDYGKYTDDRNFSYGVYSDDKNYAYSDYRNNIEDAKWQEQQEYAQYMDKVNLDYGIYSDDKSYEYSDYRNTIEDAKWQEENEYKQYLDKLGIAYDEHMNAYELEQQDIDNAYRETTRQDALNSEEKAYARADLEAIAASGGDATDEQLKAAGMSREAFEAMKAISSGDEESALEHVGAMSSKEIVDTLETYAADGNNTAVEALLDDAFMTGRIDEETYLDLKKKYLRTNSHTITDTTVATPSGGSSGGGGGYGLAGFSPSYK